MTRNQLMVSMVLSLAIFSQALAQQHIIDFLEQQLIEPTNGLSEVEILNELSWYYADFNPNTGIDKSNLAIELAKEKSDSLQLGIAHERLAANHQKLGTDSLVIKNYTIAEMIYKSIDHKPRLGALSFNLGNFYMYRSKYNESIKKGNIALNTFLNLKDSIKVARIYNQLALNHMYLGDYSKSLDRFQKGKLLLENCNKSNTVYYAEILGNTGLIYEKLEDYDSALDYQNMALSIHQNNNNRIGLSNTYNNLGKLYGKKEQHEVSLEMFLKSYDLKKNSSNQYRIANALTNIGTSYSELGNNLKAIELLNEAKEIYEKIEHHSNMSIANINLGDVYLEMNNPNLAEKSFKEAAFFAKKAEDKRNLFLATQGLSKTASLKRDYKNAYKFQEEALEFRETFLSDDKKDEIANIKAQYKYDKEKAILEANMAKDKALSEAKLQRQIFNRNMSIGVGAFIVSSTLFGVFMYRRRKEAEATASIANSKLQTLKAQINPHFMFNALNSVNDYIVKNNKEQASSYLHKLSAMMRSILDGSAEDLIPLEEEITFLENYIKIEQERFNNNFQYKIDVHESINTSEVLVPPALLQPLVENSILHGLSKLEENGQLSICFDSKNETLIGVVEDNGVGMSPKTSSSGSKHSFGLKSVRDRINLLNTSKNFNAKIDLVEKDRGLRVIVHLPLILDI